MKDKTDQFHTPTAASNDHSQAAGDLIAGITGAFERIRQRDTESTARYGRELADFIAARGEVRPCAQHPGEVERLDHARCVNLMAQKGVDPQRFTPFWLPCPACVTETRFGLYYERWHRHGVPVVHVGASLDDLAYDTEEGRANLQTCRTYGANPMGVLVMFGKVGTGKSHVACAILQARKDGCFTTQSQLLKDHRKTYNDPNAPDVRARARNCGLLVLDEIGVSVGGSDEESLLMDVLGHRYNEALPGILTSNLSEEEFADEMGKRLMDRFGQSLYSVLHFREPSKRAAKQERYFQLIQLAHKHRQAGTSAKSNHQPK